MYEESAFQKVKNAKIRNRYNQVLHLNRGTIKESDKTQRNTIHKRAKRSANSQEQTQYCKERTAQYNKDKRET